MCCIFFSDELFITRILQRRTCKKQNTENLQLESKTQYNEWFSIIFYSITPVLNLKIMNNNNFSKIILIFRSTNKKKCTYIVDYNFYLWKTNLTNGGIWNACRDLTILCWRRCNYIIYSTPTFVFSAYL